ncbi:ABC transporter ATP-binding protein/permease [Pseudomonas rhodesiae]|uniref:ABC transporter ATP-binding protein/permease n=1 Tax=Pseudomonas rhodesiae TaxID=76760 RepID=UPI000F48C869|nr:ABC transporter ATP-binding protein/permease [Pseudomonas rhodesiae]
MTSSTSALDDGHILPLPESTSGHSIAERPSIGQVLLPFWFSSEKWLALGLVSVILTLTFVGTYGAVTLNEYQGKLTDALVALDWEALKPLFLFSLLLGVVTGVLPSGSSIISGYLELRWRTWMTHFHLDKWTRNAHFFALERDGLISNADQRIAEDIRQTVEVTIKLLISSTLVTVNTVTYSIVLWNLAGALEFEVFNHQFSMTGYMVYAVFIYQFLQLLISHWLGKNLIGLNMHKQTVEADFRHQGMQLREYAEQIAFYGGEEREKRSMVERFSRIRANTIQLLTRTFSVTLGQTFYNHSLTLLPTLLVLPLLLASKISYGQMVSIIGAYAMLAGTVAFFPQAYITFTEWLGLTNRLRDLQWAINKVEQQQSEISHLNSLGPYLHCEALSLFTPKGKALARLDSWTVEKGERWLIKGRSGSGKSTLLRALAGLWPYGAGQICLPHGRQSLFLPQKSYIPTGLLKDALCYPHTSSDFTDDQCRQALIDCCLPALSDSLTVRERWQQTLSGGEQQRLAMARVLLQRPSFIFLDEATSALDPETENSIYTTLIEQLPESTLISVAHRESLARFHSHTLDLTHSQ